MSYEGKSALSRTPIVRLVSFGGGVPGIEAASERLIRQATRFTLIDSAHVYTPEELGSNYFDLFGNLTAEFPRGYGLWSWKPYIVLKELLKLRENDILVYVDVGVEINQRGEQKFSEYLDHTSQNGSLFFSVGVPQRHWTKPSQLLVPEEHFYRNQIVAGAFLLKVGPSSIRLVQRWLELCKINGAELLKDELSPYTTLAPGFIAHRHDQSILSSVIYNAGIGVRTSDETYFESWRKGRDYPFLAFRNKQTGFSWIKPAILLPKWMFTLVQWASLTLTPGVLKHKLQHRTPRWFRSTSWPNGARL